MTDAAEVEALLATIDAGAAGFTLCRIAPGIRLVGAPFDGVTVLVVVDGAMRLELPSGDSCVARAGQLALVPAGIQPQMAVEGEPVRHSMGGRHSLTRQDGWLVADATRGQPATLTVAAARMTGTTGRSLDGVLLARLGELPEGRQAMAMLRA